MQSGEIVFITTQRTQTAICESRYFDCAKIRWSLEIHNTGRRISLNVLASDLFYFSSLFFLAQVFDYWVEKRKKLKRPLIERYVPAPDPEDPSPYVAFRPREKGTKSVAWFHLRFIHSSLFCLACCWSVFRFISFPFHVLFYLTSLPEGYKLRRVRRTPEQVNLIFYSHIFFWVWSSVTN